MMVIYQPEAWAQSSCFTVGLLNALSEINSKQVSKEFSKENNLFEGKIMGEIVGKRSNSCLIRRF